MIKIFHFGNSVTSIEAYDIDLIFEASDFTGLYLSEVLLKLGKKFPNEVLVWCRVELKSWLNSGDISNLLRHPLQLISFRQSGDVFNYSLDYIDYSTSIKVQSDVRYPTWKMSSTVGAAYGGLFGSLPKTFDEFKEADFFLSALAKALQPIGLLCYHEPMLIIPEAPKVEESVQNDQAVFRFVRQLFSSQWFFFLFVAKVLFEGSWKVSSLIRALFYPKLKIEVNTLDKLRIPIQSLETQEISLDVLIPTLGREPYVLDLLRDLAIQTIVPKKVIIIEQERENGLGSQMSFLTEEVWPFEIDHTFSVKRGPCFARNIGLEKVTAEWVFMADDDIRLEKTSFEDILVQVKTLQVDAATVSCLLQGQHEESQFPYQTRIFGAGCSVVKRTVLEYAKFDMAYEFGYAEDSDFGAQLRNLGHDVVYLPTPTILHLKAPIGGFRAKVIFPWDLEYLTPKPSPTVMLFWKKHFSPNQFKGNKLMLFLKLFKKQGLRSPRQFIKEFKIKWEISLRYASQLESGEVRTSSSHA